MGPERCDDCGMLLYGDHEAPPPVWTPHHPFADRPRHSPERCHLAAVLRDAAAAALPGWWVLVLAHPTLDALVVRVQSVQATVVACSHAVALPGSGGGPVSWAAACDFAAQVLVAQVDASDVPRW